MGPAPTQALQGPWRFQLDRRSCTEKEAVEIEVDALTRMYRPSLRTHDPFLPRRR